MGLWRGAGVGSQIYSALYCCKLADPSLGTDSIALQPFITLPPFLPPSTAMKQSDAVAKVTWGLEGGAGLDGTDEVVCYLSAWLM